MEQEALKAYSHKDIDPELANRELEKMKRGGLRPQPEIHAPTFEPDEDDWKRREHEDKTGRGVTHIEFSGKIK